MKKLVAPGRSLILSQPKFRRGRNFNPWPSHGSSGQNISVGGFADGNWSPYFLTNLKDGSEFFYVAPGELNTPASVAFYYEYTKFVSANGFVGYIGEWYNFSFRATCNMKMTRDEYTAYLGK